MKMAANSFTPVSDKLIPTGSVASVAGTVFDLRTPTRSIVILITFDIRLPPLIQNISPTFTFLILFLFYH